jgi:NADH-quinone oxidoreductase subunit L
LLIGYWFKNTEYNKAANKAFIMNRIGDLGFLIAIFWIISKVGTTNFSDVFASTNSFSPSEITIITLLLFVGATGKSAQIPLYTWLPDAMAGPTPVSALIHAATMVTAGIYMIARSNALYSLSELSMNVVAIVGLATSILGATIALKQNDIKKVLAYSTVSQLGYMFLALGVGAYSTGVFHVMTHAFFKALLFLAAGSVIHAMGGEQDIRKMGGLNRLKITSITFLIGCIAIAGVPPFSGFFSKDAILLAALEQRRFGIVLYVTALFGAMLTAYYMFRLFVITFTGKFRGTGEQEHHLHESPPAMTIVLVILAILSVIGGFIGIPDVIMKGGDKLTEFLAPVIPVKVGEAVSSTTELSLMALSTGLVLVAIIFAWFRFRKYEFKPSKGLGKVLENKWYVDEFYDAIIVKPLNKLGEILNEGLEKSGIDALVNGIGRAVQYGGRQLRWLQSGQVGSYVLLMVVSIVLFFVLQFFLRK